MRDVVTPLAQGGDVDRDHRQAEVQIFAELPALDLFFQVALGSGHDAGVGAQRLVAAHPPELVALDHPQQLGLHVDRKLADLVQEHRALAGGLEGALAGGHGAGEGATLVAEQLALDQVVADRAAVNDHEGRAGPPALLVNAAGQDVFAGAGLALEQHRRVGGGDVLEHAEQRAHRQAGAQRFAELALLAGQNVRAVGFGSQDQIHVADGEGGAGFDRGFAHDGAPHAGVVGRAQVLDRDAVGAAAELAVVARDGVVGQHQIVVRGLADPDALAHAEPLAAGLAGDHHQHQLVGRAFGGARGAGDELRV
jgi:hypothetical protein